MARDMTKFSPSMMGKFEACARCFWLWRNKGHDWPRGIFPSLPSGIDHIMKGYLDAHRNAGTLPPEFAGQIPENLRLFNDQALMDKWRDWRTGPTCDVEGHDGQVLTMRGALDDLLVDPATSKVFVFDVKTNGFGPKEGSTEKYYGRQASCYVAQLRGEGYDVSEDAYFAYYHPKQARNNAHIDFNCTVKCIHGSEEKARALIVACHKCLCGPLPKAVPYDRKDYSGCEQCAYVAKRAELMVGLSEAAGS